MTMTLKLNFKFTIVHSGTFLPGYRTANTFLLALRELLNARLDLSQRIQVLFVGKIGEEQKLIREWKPEWKTEMEDVSAKLGAQRQDSLVSARQIRQPIVAKDDIQNAFDLYLGESARGFVHRQEVPIEEALERILRTGGVPSLAHPVRVAKNNSP